VEDRRRTADKQNQVDDGTDGTGLQKSCRCRAALPGFGLYPAFHAMAAATAIPPKLTAAATGQTAPPSITVGICMVHICLNRPSVERNLPASKPRSVIED